MSSHSSHVGNRWFFPCLAMSDCWELSLPEQIFPLARSFWQVFGSTGLTSERFIVLPCIANSRGRQKCRKCHEQVHPYIILHQISRISRLRDMRQHWGFETEFKFRNFKNKYESDNNFLLLLGIHFDFQMIISSFKVFFTFNLKILCKKKNTILLHKTE